MAVMAYWRGMKWGVSNKEIAFLEGLSTSFGIETSTNADKEGSSSTETVAETLIEFSISTTYSVETGTADVLKKINKWKKKIGKVGPLVLGDSGVFGPDNVQLQKVDVSDMRISPNGIIRGATLTFSFKEFVGETSKKVSTKSKNGSKKTAKNIKASANDKANKKPLNIKATKS